MISTARHQAANGLSKDRPRDPIDWRYENIPKTVIPNRNLPPRRQLLNVATAAKNQKREAVS